MLTVLMAAARKDPTLKLGELDVFRSIAIG